jgi:hypothetical protein
MMIFKKDKKKIGHFVYSYGIDVIHQQKFCIICGSYIDFQDDNLYFYMADYHAYHNIGDNCLGKLSGGK